MGFFTNLFGKKTCDVCGGDFGGKMVHRLKDGRCCTPCALKMSIWTGDRSRMTVAEARRQIEWREAHREDARDFYPTGIYGFIPWIMVDEKTRRFTATRDLNIRKHTVDILAFSQIRELKTCIEEKKEEVLRECTDTDRYHADISHRESYFPRRYRYGYNFLLQLTLDHPFIHHMEVSISGGSIDVLTGELGRQEGRTRPPTEEERMEDPYYARFAGELEELKRILLDPTPPEKQDKIPREQMIFGPMLSVFQKACEDLREAGQQRHAGMTASAQWVRNQSLMAIQDAAKTAKAAAAKAGVEEIIAKYTEE